MGPKVYKCVSYLSHRIQLCSMCRGKDLLTVSVMIISGQEVLCNFQASHLCNQSPLPQVFYHATETWKVGVVCEKLPVFDGDTC